jgi:hypothetical protein
VRETKTNGSRIKNLDPRLEDVDLTKPRQVYRALGGNHQPESFDLVSYLLLPLGSRLLTPEELEAISPDLRRPILIKDNDGEDDSFLDACCSLGEGGVNSWPLNWDPKSQQTVYPNDSEIPEGLVTSICSLLNQNSHAKRSETVFDPSDEMDFFKPD